MARNGGEGGLVSPYYKKRRLKPMAHKKGAGSTKNGRDSNPQKLGVKRFAGQWVLPGEVVVRQRGATFKPSPTQTYQGRDFTIHSKQAGFISVKGRGVQVGAAGGSVEDILVWKLASLWSVQ